MVQQVDFITLHPGDEDVLSTSSYSSCPSSCSSSTTDSSMASASSSPMAARRPEVVICEQVEEVETVYSDSGSYSSSPLLEPPTHKVLFPELGLDLVEEGEEEEYSVTLTSSSWQENWLFKRGRGEGGDDVREGVTMLVPNPTCLAKAQIGNRDFDLVSELSERQSVGSFDISSSSDEEMEREEEEEEERDQEYTIYSVLPNRRQSQSLLEAEQLLQSQTEPQSPSMPKKLQDSLSTAQPDHSLATKQPNSQEQSQLGPSTVEPPYSQEHWPPSFKGGTKCDLVMTASPGDCTVHEGKLLTLACTVTGSRPVDMCWFQGATPLSPSPHHWLYKRGNTHHLAIFGIDRAAAGQYRVCAFNNTGEVWHSFSVAVRGSRRAEHPPELVVYPDSRTQEWGMGAIFTCQAGGYPEPRLTFHRAGRNIGDNENCTVAYLGAGEWQCRVRSVTEREAGTWGVTAENRLGSSCRDWRVTVGPREEEVSSGGECDEEEEEEEEHGDSDPEEEVLPDMSITSADLYTATPAVVTPDLSSLLAVGERGRVLHLGHQVGESSTDSPLPPTSSPPALDPAPAPGSVADRQHRKWEEAAVELAHNPYSSEAVAQRRLSLSRKASFSTPNLHSTTGSSQNTLRAPEEQARRIDCGLRSVVASRYSRDYIILPSGRESEQRREESPSASPVIWAQGSPGESGEEGGESTEDRSEEGGESTEDRQGGDSGVGSSSERTSVTAVSVTEEIRRYEDTLVRAEAETSWQRPQRNSIISSTDSLLDTEDLTCPPSQSQPSPAPLPARRRLSTSPPKKVTIAPEESVRVHSVSCDLEEALEDSEDDLGPPPSLPSVRELAVKFQPKKSPEPKPRRSLLKKKAADRLQKAAAGSAYQVHSLTARSVPRAFRDGLRKGVSAQRDNIVRGPQGHQVVNRGQYTSEVASSQVTIVYDSRSESEWPRSSSPEYSGIPATPMVITARRVQAEQGYTSDESNLSQQPRRRERGRAAERVTWA